MAKKRSRPLKKGKKSGMKKKSKRKLTTTRKPTSTSTSEVNKHLHVVANPFSGATQHPKIPDGKVPNSLSRRLRNTVSFTASTSTYTDILIGPTFGNLANTFGASIDSAKGSGIIGAVGQTAGIIGNFVGAGPYTITPAGNIAKQRIVSQAIRLTQINNDEQNDGWYECCRLNIPKQSTFYGFCNIDNTDTTMNGSKNAVLFPDQSVQASYLNGLPLVEQPGYTSGMLKDLKNKEFKLQPVGCEAHMNEAPTIIATQGTNVNVEATDRWVGLLVSAMDDQLLELGLDDSWDWILIRIHGRQVGGSPSSFIAECIQNVEFCFSPNSDLATFQTPNVRHKQIEMVMDKMNNNAKAESMRVG